MKTNRITRRQFLVRSGILLAGGALGSCAAPSPTSAPAQQTESPTQGPSAVPTTPPITGPTTVPCDSLNIFRSAAFSSISGRKKLPAVDQRLPSNPLVWDFPDVNVFETEAGKYGGTVRLAHQFDIVAMASIGLTRVNADRTAFYADIAEKWSVSPDAKQWTFTLRKDMKWSDGNPFTVDDILFWWNDIAHSKYLAAPMTISGMDPNKDKMSKVDDITLQLDFVDPNPLFLRKSRGFAGGEPSSVFRYPTHYAKKLHPDYTPIAGKDPKAQFQEMVDAAAFPRVCEDPTRPVIWAWKPMEYKEGQLARLERNPYFWVVDKKGQQLPFIDYFEDFLLADKDAQVIKLKLLAGEVHFERRTATVADIPTYVENENKAGVDVILTVNTSGSNCALDFNTAHQDPKMRELQDQADFRRALSIAVNRETIRQTALFGLGRVGHGLSAPGEYDESIDGLWAQYDPEKSNQMLDAIGLDKRDSEGFRTYSDGDKLTMVIDLQQGWGLSPDESMQIVAEGWNAVGIRTIVKANEGKIHQENFANQNFDAWQEFWWGGVWDQDYTYGSGVYRWAKAQAKWWRTRNLDADKRTGEEPKGYIKELFEIEDRISLAMDEEARQADIQLHRKIIAENIPGMGFVQGLPGVQIVSKKLRGAWGRSDQMKWVHGKGDEDFWPRSWFFA